MHASHDHLLHLGCTAYRFQPAGATVIPVYERLREVLTDFIFAVEPLAKVISLVNC